MYGPLQGPYMHTCVIQLILVCVCIYACIIYVRVCVTTCCMCVYVCACMCVCACRCVHACVCVHSSACAEANITPPPTIQVGAHSCDMDNL